MNEVHETGGNMPTRRISRGALGLILVLVAVLVAMICQPRLRSRDLIIDSIPQTAIQMINFKYALQMYEVDYDKLPDLPALPNGERENAAVISILNARTNDLVAARYNPQHKAYMELPDKRLSTKGEFLDPWQHPYHFAWDNNAVDSKSSSNNARASDSIRIWSDGPNGRNENGAGDDRRSWR
jgi:hypothetical protein